MGKTRRHKDITDECTYNSEPKSIDQMTKDEVLEEAKNAQAELERIGIIGVQKKKLDNLRRHISKVQDAAQILADRLIEQGEIYFARKLLANSMIHDLSKFCGIEWDYLVKDDSHVEIEGEKLAMAIYQHVHSNDHHPECWDGIDNMSEIAIAEMICDWYARSSESASNLRQWIKSVAIGKYNIKPQGKTYKRIKKFVDLLLDVPLKTIKPKS